MEGMDFFVDLLTTMVAEVGLEFGLTALFKLPRIAAGLRTDALQTLFSRHTLD